MHEHFLNGKLQQRKAADAFRELQTANGGVDLCSNDYLGIVRNRLIGSDAQLSHGSTGSRLISGNYPLIEDTEKFIADFHDAEAALLFNSGYDANTGLLSCVPQRNDTVLYDELSHASIRDGLRLSMSRSHSFRHNNCADLEKKLLSATGNIFVVTESVFSMDGDTAPLREIAFLCTQHNAMLIVDEAHATGVIGSKGEGLVQKLQLQHRCFARVHTFGKAAGCHGAVVLGSALLRNYLVNFSRPFIYTTALPPSAVSAIGKAYAIFAKMDDERSHLAALISMFRERCSGLQLCDSSTAIQGVIIPGNGQVRKAASDLRQNGFDVRPILYPTVPQGAERLRIVLHSFNTFDEIDRLCTYLPVFANKKNQ
jgi:8-amino-7-oxononanoate synthase